MGDANALSRADHETQVDTKLVRKRTQAKVRSDEQRMRQQQYAQQQQQQQQQQYKQHQPQHQQFQQPQQGPRYGGNGQSSYGSAPVSTQSATIRRRDTLRQVEAAAGRISQTPSTPTIPSSNHGQHRQSYQLSDRPASRLSTDSAPAKFNASGGSALPAGRQQQSIPVQQHASKPATFAEVSMSDRIETAMLLRVLIFDPNFRWASRPRQLKETSAVSCDGIPCNPFIFDSTCTFAQLQSDTSK